MELESKQDSNSNKINNIMKSLTNHFAGSYRIRILLGSLLATIVADGIITKYLVLNGYAVEGNPFLYFWVGHDAFLTFKLLGGLIAAFYLWGIYRRHSKLSIFFSSLFLAVYTFIIFWNLLIWNRIGGSLIRPIPRRINSGLTPAA